MCGTLCAHSHAFQAGPPTFSKVVRFGCMEEVTGRERRWRFQFAIQQLLTVPEPLFVPGHVRVAFIPFWLSVKGRPSGQSFKAETFLCDYIATCAMSECQPWQRRAYESVSMSIRIHTVRLTPVPTPWIALAIRVLERYNCLLLAAPSLQACRRVGSV